MSYIYKFEYGGYEGSWHFFMKHKNKYTNEELQKILDNITSNYKLLTALDLIDDWDNDSESFLYLFDDFVNTKKWESILTKKCMFERYSHHIQEILKEYHEFEPWAVKQEATAGYSEWEK